MGWDTCGAWHSKEDVLNDLKKSMARSNWKVHAEKKTRDGAWYVVELPSGEKMLYFGMIEARRSGKFTEWALKTLPESCGPASDSCPLKFFEMVPCPEGEYAGPWREKVKAAHARAKRTLVVGQKIKLYGKVYEVTYNDFKNVYAKNEDGKVFKITKKNIKDYQEVE